MRRILVVVTAALFVLAGCGGDDTTTANTTSSTSTTEVEGRRMIVRIAAQLSGLGSCTGSLERSGLDVGNGARVQLQDGTGETLGVGTFELQPGKDACDWRAEVDDVPTDRDFYRVIAGTEAATLSRDELRSQAWTVQLLVDVRGDVRPM